MTDSNSNYAIAVLPGDGIGREVMAAALEVLHATGHRIGRRFDTVAHPAGAQHYLDCGDALPDATLAACRDAHAILFGAMGLPHVRATDGTEIIPQLDIRFALDLYTGVRPIRSWPGLPGPLSSPLAAGIDLVLVRESTEGLFYARGRGVVQADAAYDTMMISRAGTARVCDFALNLVMKPWTYDVLVTENMFGDILSDLIAALVGGMGMAPSADIGDKYALFQPAHGTAPDIAGQGIANPSAMILSAAMMLDWLAERHGDAALADGARVIEAALQGALASGAVRPRDFGGTSSTGDIVRADALGAGFGISGCFTDVSEMLDTVRPDLLDVVLPPAAQGAVVQLALERHIPTICQKPFGVDLAQAEAMVALAEKNNTLLVVQENFRFTPWFRECRCLIDAGHFGRLHGIMFRLRPGDGQGQHAYLDRQPYFQTMEQLLVRETAVHFIDTFRYLMGEVEAVTARLRRLNPVIAGEDAGLIIFEFADAATGLFDGNRLNDHVAENTRRTMGEMWLEGERGVLRLDGAARLWWKPHHGSEVEHTYRQVHPGAFGGACALLQSHVLAQTVLKFSHTDQQAGARQAAATLFARKVEELTQGRYKVQVFCCSQLGNDPKNIEQLALGGIDFTVSGTGSDADKKAVTEAAQIAAKFSRTMIAGNDDSQLKEMASKGAKINAKPNLAAFRSAVQPVYAKAKEKYGADVDIFLKDAEAVRKVAK